MRCFLLSLSGVCLLLLPACNFRSSTSEVEVVPVAPAPISDSPPAAVTEDVIERVEPAAVSPPAAPEFSLDPAPAPPSESSTSSSEEAPTASTSAEDVFNSVARVLQGAVEGEHDGADADSNGAIFGSISRALSKGFQEAAAGESAQEE